MHKSHSFVFSKVKMIKKFKFYRQLDSQDCGPTCLRMIAKHYGKSLSLDFLREKTDIDIDGVSLTDLATTCDKVGMKSLVTSMDYNTLVHKAPLPLIAFWNQKHYVVVYQIKKDKVYVADPGYGKIVYNKEEFLNGWSDDHFQKDKESGIVLLIEPTYEFYEIYDSTKKKNGLSLLIPYIKSYKSYFRQLIIALFLSSILQLILPFLTQAVVDKGIRYQDLDFIKLILIGQLVVFISQISIRSIRGWLLIHLGVRVNLKISSDFLFKLMRLPQSFFEARGIGDLIQRVDDNKRIEQFLTSQSLNVIFAAFNILVLSSILFLYDSTIGWVFIVGSCLYVVWINSFMKTRELLDYKKFNEFSDNSTSMIQLIHAMPEIKLNGSQRRRRWEWESIQAKIFGLATKSLTITQLQGLGGSFINETKNIVITFLAANAVVEGNMTLGMMIAIEFIIGQISVPLNNILLMLQEAQDARISMERVSEVHSKKEEDHDAIYENIVGKDRSIYTDNLSFNYTKNGSDVISKINIEIQQGRVMAIVGPSGSGKTTIFKLLLKFYDNYDGSIKIGENNLKNISASSWRSRCGVVMQDGYIFNDTLLRNITESKSENVLDKDMLAQAVEISGVSEFVDELPLGYNTRISSSSFGGRSLSGGQKQRILLARAIYKDPEYLFLDEATSSLDANSEKKVMVGLSEFFKERTVFIIAHRLSTVKNADKIYVIDKGKIIEQGNHQNLIKRKGQYYELVRNQLDLGE